MVGEIRDSETAGMAIQAALTGHLVFSTLHTNDAAGAVARLLDLGVEPYLVASSLLGVLAQRLVRRICKNCGAPYGPTATELGRLELEGDSVMNGDFYKGQGCDECMNTGYRGREGIFELLRVDENIRQMIVHQAKASGIKSAAIESGMTTLRINGFEKAARGITTLEEVARVTSRDET
jgi:type II secretory ATPase GspE/PulE/Tfp pilus assembly ATPase PilB-like protein